MSSYYEQLQLNRQLAGDRPDPVRDDWRVKVATTPSLQYDTCYDYAMEVEPRLISDYKNKYKLLDPDLCAKMTLYEPNGSVDKHKLAYNYWIDYKYADFKKNYKSENDNDGLNYIYLTINFKSDTPISIVIQETNRIINLGIFAETKITYIYEYFTSEGSHPHVHALIELKRTGTIKKSDIEKAIFKKKGISNLLNLNFRFSGGKGTFKAANRAVCLAYLAGKKIEKKIEMVNNDKEWRTLNNLQELYIKE